MLNRSASLAMSTSIIKALPGKLDIKRHSPSILYLSDCTYCLTVKKASYKNVQFIDIRSAGFIQVSLSKIQGLFKEVLKSLLQFSRTKI